MSCVWSHVSYTYVYIRGYIYYVILYCPLGISYQILSDQSFEQNLLWKYIWFLIQILKFWISLLFSWVIKWFHTHVFKSTLQNIREIYIYRDSKRIYLSIILFVTFYIKYNSYYTMSCSERIVYFAWFRLSLFPLHMFHFSDLTFYNTFF